MFAGLWLLGTMAPRWAHQVEQRNEEILRRFESLDSAVAVSADVAHEQSQSQQAAAGVERRGGGYDPAPAAAVSVSVPVAPVASEAATFQRRGDGGWSLKLSLPGGVTSTESMALDMGAAELRVEFAGHGQQVFSWPLGVSQQQLDACTAKLSKRRAELLITLPGPAPASEAAAAAIDNTRTVVTAPAAPSGQVVARQPEPKTYTYADTRKPDDPDDEALSMASIYMIHSAASTGNATLVQRLLDANVSVNAQDDSYATVLEKACLAGQKGIIELLLQRGAKAKGLPHAPSSPLHCAAGLGGALGRDICKLLLDHGANPGTPDSGGRTPAKVAQDAGFKQIQALLGG